MEDLRKSIKEAGGISLKQLYEEIEQYFVMLPKIHEYPIKLELNKPRHEILYEFDLIDKLYDPLYLPEVLKLAEDMKENNFNFFESHWNTHGYYHHTHGYKLKEIIKNLTSIANKIKEARIKKLDSALEKVIKLSTKELTETPKLFIDIKLDDFDLSEFERYRDLINKAAYHHSFYNLLPIMLRTLFENVLWSIFREGLDKKHTELYYNKYKRRVRDFSELIYLLDFLKDKDLDPYCKNIINNNSIDILKKIREIGNWTVHEILEQIDKNFADEWKDKLNRILEGLALLYKNIKGKNVFIAEQSNIIKIKQKLNIKTKKSESKNEITSKHKDLEPSIQINTKEGIIDFLKNLENGEYESILNRFYDYRYRQIFESLFTEIKLETGFLTLISNSFIILIGVEDILQIDPILKKQKEFGDKWKKLTKKERIHYWLEDFKKRAHLVHGISL